ncbi:MAG TPA: efflux RND transporter permease subunit [Trebonia sp.]|nr:efflux RND transporter permease subunit [Trebonia sp.]
MAESDEAPTRGVADLRSVIDACIRYRLLVIALAAVVMVLGILQLSRMPTDVLPETSPVTVDIQTEAAGLSAPEVESLVTTPLEKNLLEGVLDVTDVTSDSIEGLSDIELHFAPGTNLYTARQLVQERLTGAFVLPNVSKPPVMVQPVSSSSDVMLVGLTSRQFSDIDMSVAARWVIVPKLLSLAGVTNVSTFGQADRQLQVLVNPSQLISKHVTLDQVIETAGDAQLTSPLSYLQGNTPGTAGFIEDMLQRMTIQPVLPFGTPQNMAGLPVVNAPGTSLGDVATMVQGSPPLAGAGQQNGSPALVLVVQKAPGASVLTVSHEIDAAIANLKSGLPQIAFNTSLFREDTYLNSSLSNLRTALIIGGILMAVALLALLLSLRLAFAALAGIALSFVAATALVSLLGYTFNALVTLGLLLALGFVVTEAAGSAQAIRSRLRADAAGEAAAAAGNAGATQNGAGGNRAARAARVVAAACGELRGALMGAGVAALACVVPLLIATGLTATFLRPMAIAFALGIVVAMIVAVTVTPALAVLVMEPGPRRARTAAGMHAAGRSATGRTGWGARAGAAYGRGITRVAAAPSLAVAALGLAAAAGIAALAALPFVHASQPQFADRSLVMRVSGAPGTSLTEMSRMTSLVTGELRALPSVQSVGATLGRATNSDQVENVNTGELWITLKPGVNYGQASSQIGAIADGTPGLTGTVSTYEADSMTGVLTSGSDKVVTRVYGVNGAELAKVAGQLSGTVAQIPGVTGTAVSTPVTQPTIDINVNVAAAARDGISPGDARREAGTLVSGLTVGNYFQNQEVFDVVVWGLPATRSSLTSIDNLLLDTPNGGHVRLGHIASVAVQPQPSDIPQEAMSQYADVTATVSGGSAGSVRQAIAAKLDGMAFPADYHAELVTPTQYGNVLAGTAAGNLLSPNGGSGGTSRIAFIAYVTAVLVAVLLIAQAVTGSWRLGFTSFLLLPACLSGAVLVTFATGQQGTLAAAAGLLAVFALAVRLVIGLAARLRAGATGVPGAGTGFGSLAQVAVPVGVIAVTLVPFIVMGDVPGMELLHTAAAVILGGLATTALVCLFVLPVITSLFGPALTAAPADTLAEIAMAGQSVDGVPVQSAHQPAEPPGTHGAAVGAGVEQAAVRDHGGVPHDRPPHPGTDPPGGPRPPGAGGIRGDT